MDGHSVPQTAACLAAGLLLTVAGPATAQDDDDSLEEVIVTGSRIQASGMQTPTPVTIMSADELEAAAPTTLIEGVSQLPIFFANQTPTSTDSWFLRGGYGNLNLRGLGINRTLTLLNGRRMTSSTAFGGVDINNFPEAALQRVETVTGGASAAYGTDAVAGVTNFILDTDFTGFEGEVQVGATAEGDGDTSELSLTFGTSIGDRGHLIVSGEMFEQDQVNSYNDRDWYRAWGTVPDANGMLLIRPDVVSTNASFDGLIFAPGSSLNGQAFDRDGNLSPFVVSDTAWSPAPFQVGIIPARQSITNGGSGDDLGSEGITLMPEIERQSFFLYYDFEATENLTLFAQALYGSTETNRFNDPRASLQGTPTSITIFQDNAFLSPAIRQTMVDEGLASFTFRRMGSLEDIGSDIRLWDENEITSFTGGFQLDIENGGFLDGWTVDGYAQLGKSDRKGYQTGLRVDRIHAAVDAVDDGNGNIVCRTTLFSTAFGDCQPLNLFGRGNASAAAIDYVVGNDPGEQITTPLFIAGSGFDQGLTDSYVAGPAKVNLIDFEQNVFELTATGEIFEGWAGPISLATGIAYREEEISQTVRDSTNQSSDHENGHPVLCDSDQEAIDAGLRGVSAPDCANTVGVQYSKVSNIRGDQDVKEFFVETFVPVIADQPYMQLATVGLAARWADYSGSGDVLAWKAGLDMQITDSFRIRATQSRDVRAGNMSERFDLTGGVAVINDPRYNETYNVTRFSGGNPGVDPEEADTTTAGIVWQPGFIEGLSISYDWYQVDIDGAIGQLGVQAVVDRCEAGATDLCALVTRNTVDDRLILVGDVFINIDQAVVRGSDLEIAYGRDVTWFGGDESFGARLFASWLDENSEILGGTRKIDRAGQTGIQQSDGVAYALPDFKWTGNVTYANGPFSAFLQGRYIGNGTIENSLQAGVDIERNRVSSALYADLRLGYTWEHSSGTAMEFFANVTNLTDEDPPITPYYSVFLSHAQQTNGNLFDLLGRRYTVGLRVNFE